MPADQLAEDAKLLKRIDEHGTGLTDWETGFLESVLERVDGGRELTERQRETAISIDEKRVR